MTETIRFKRDTSFRKLMFTGDSFAHPAKMDSHLLLYLVRRYTKPGETILDPMFGSGTCMLACTIGRHVVGIELEEKFVKMSQANWEKVRTMPQLGNGMGECTIIHGDARNLSGLLADTCLFSPPYAEVHKFQDKTFVPIQNSVKTNQYRSPEAIERQREGYGTSEGQIGSLPYGDIQAVITSPPYAEQNVRDLANEGYGSQLTGGAQRNVRQVAPYSSDPSNIGNLKYGQIDHILTSPPYEGITGAGKEIGSEGHAVGAFDYGSDKAQIGNLKSSNYLEAMLLVYRECFKVLRPGGLLILVLKNFIRDRKVVRLDLDTIKLCESCGFVLKETLQRELPGQSFWRVIYKQRYPDAPEIKFEDVLVFDKPIKVETAPLL